MLPTTEILVRNALKRTFTNISLHSDHPGSTGLHELEVGRPYIEWADEGFEIVNANELRWEIPAGTAVRWIGLWSADGVLYEARQVPEEVFNRAGAYYVRADRLRIEVRVNG